MKTIFAIMISYLLLAMTLPVACSSRPAMDATDSAFDATPVECPAAEVTPCEARNVVCLLDGARATCMQRSPEDPTIHMCLHAVRNLDVTSICTTGLAESSAATVMFQAFVDDEPALIRTAPLGSCFDLDTSIVAGHVFRVAAQGVGTSTIGFLVDGDGQWL